ncbi:NUP35 protein [Thecamonas trahens ATCC 50062]|uniref:NUP35 protein n=1 Tax=Thecamonas trahens ATCC 50062 TaxID=461836 RepID=A0A0L0DBQ2_THETB|nr:NUP35 protein [Thecamonas trahens ATCC 50062]KNC49526.1 NUP35 protein [Thecamonas trahens ATCC 50062]|eukprot:XP_013757641.1 NUP35 protein [Thecamonas trahens ATCC 50062]
MSYPVGKTPREPFASFSNRLPVTPRETEPKYLPSHILGRTTGTLNSSSSLVDLPLPHGMRQASPSNHRRHMSPGGEYADPHGPRSRHPQPHHRYPSPMAASAGSMPRASSMALSSRGATPYGDERSRLRHRAPSEFAASGASGFHGYPGSEHPGEVGDAGANAPPKALGQSVYAQLKPSSDITESPAGRTGYPSEGPAALGASVNRGSLANSSQLGASSSAPRHSSKKKPFDNRWITVFGFPTSSTSFLLKHFQRYGEILNYLPGQGNWIHIEYAQPIHAQQALARNGTIFNEKLMIGVMLSEDVDPYELQAPVWGNDAIGIGAGAPQARIIADGPASSVFKRPTASRSFIAKIFEYLFGW